LKAASRVWILTFANLIQQLAALPGRSGLHR
jgi:hypothetical protein